MSSTMDRQLRWISGCLKSTRGWFDTIPVHQMEIEKKTVTAKTRKLKGTWTVGVQPAPTIEELEEEFREVYDRWCWETGSDKDKKRLDELLEEIKFQKNQIYMEVFNENSKLNKLYL